MIPTLCSAAKEGLETTLMERLLALHGNQAMRMLTTQYRMHEDIMQWSSQQLYDNKLVAHKSVAGHLLRYMWTFTQIYVDIYSGYMWTFITQIYVDIYSGYIRTVTQGI